MCLYVGLWFFMFFVFKVFLHLWKILVTSLFFLKYYLTPLPLFMPSGTLILKMLKCKYLFYISLKMSLTLDLFLSSYSPTLLVNFCRLALSSLIHSSALFFCTSFCTVRSFDQYSTTMYCMHIVMWLCYKCLLHINEC